MDEKDEFIKILEDKKKTFNRVFTSADGAEVLKLLEKRYYIHRPIAFNTELGLAYYEGQRSVVLAIKDLMDLEKKAPQAPDEKEPKKKEG